jgi:Ca2+-transporting ATPase
MILWINLVTDGAPAVALSMDTPREDVMQYRPRNPQAGILHGMTRFILAYIILQSGTTILTFWWKYYASGSPLAVARTVTFMQACLFELVVVWNCRSEHHNALHIGLFSNRALVVAVLASALLTVSLCYVPIFQLMFDTVPLTLTDWLWIGASALLGLAVVPEVFITKEERTRYDQNPEV